MARTVFSDFDRFADSIRGIAGRFVPTARSESDWWVEATALGRVELQQIQIGGAATYAGDGTQGTLTLGIPMSDPRRIRIDGHALEENSLIYLKHAQPFTFAARQVTRWAGVTIRLRFDAAADGFDDHYVMRTLQPGTRAQSRLDCLDRLRQLIARIGAPGDETVAFLTPAASNCAEEDVIAAVAQTIEATSPPQDRHIGRPQLSRNRVIARTLELIDAKQGQPLFIEDLCQATGVSERTLRNVFHEYFGVGPMRLLKVRQLMEIRRALLASEPSEDTVARIAARFGVWDFSLFARNYKNLFGESPSESLRRPPDRVRAMKPSWIAYAARMFTRFESAPVN
jgi:AraC family ethanolamine operon transcriptional activator